MLCSIVSAEVFACLGLLRIAILGPLHLLAEAALPPGAEDEVVLIEHLPGRRVHLQDFFWTGAEDAPPWLDPDQTLTLYETRTIHHTATVYLPEDGNEGRRPGINDVHTDPDNQGCINCIDPTPTLTDIDQDIGVLVGEDPGPRYWLLTVLRAGESVPPRVELRLARLYRAAFSRQQQKHLGLWYTDARVRRAARRRALRDKRRQNDSRGVSETESQIKRPVTNETGTAMENTTGLDMDTTLASAMEVKHMRAVQIPKEDHTKFMKENVTEKDSDNNFNRNETDATETIGTKSTEVPLLNFGRVYNYQGRTSKPLQSIFSISKRLANAENISEPFNATRAKLRDVDVGTVQVRMQNTTVTEGGATKLIYSVHLGGKPVPAATAARDMALLSEQEVALELGAPVIIQSEPYLKETRPLALSRKRDAWLFIGAAGAAVLLLAFIFVGLILAAKRKRAHSAVAAPPPQSILKSERENASSTPGLDNTGYTSETEARTEGTSQRQTPGSQRRTPLTPGTPDSVIANVHEDSSDNEQNHKRTRTSPRWGGVEYSTVVRRQRPGRRRVARTNAVDPPRTPDSMDDVTDALKTLETIESGYAPRVEGRAEEATTSPHSYLSMPSCKQFPRMRSVEPLSRVLEPVVVRHLDLELDSPEMPRRGGDFEGDNNDSYLTRVPSAINDPGVVGPIVWDLRRQKAIEDTTSETDMEPFPVSGPVGRARRRLHELLEDSFSLFGSRDPKPKEPSSSTQRPSSATRSPDHLKVLSENRGKSATVSPVGTPASEIRARPRTSLPRKGVEEAIPETGHSGPHPRGAWGSRPLSAGPFHRPTLPEVDTVRVLSDSRLPAEDPAVPLIAAIKKELEKFTPQPP